MPKCQCYGRSPFAHLAELSFDVALSGISGHGGGMYFVGDPRLRVVRDAAHGGGILPSEKNNLERVLNWAKLLPRSMIRA